MSTTKWNDGYIETEINSVMDTMGINRMPSNSEMVRVRNSSDLSNAIAKNGGFYYWAGKLGLEIKGSETKTGIAYENYAAAQLLWKGYEVERMSVRHPYDLLVNGHIKVDVKVSKAYWMKGESLVNTVGLSKKYATCDLYIIYLLEEDSELDRTLIIPSHEVKNKYLNIGKDSKYNKYIDRWDFLEVYSSLLKKLV